MTFTNSDGSLSSLTGSSAGRKSDNSLKLEHEYIDRRREIIQAEIPPALSNGINEKRNNESYLIAFHKELDALKVKRIAIMKEFELSISHAGILHYIYSNISSADLCYIMEQYKMLDVKIYFNSKSSELFPEDFFKIKYQRIHQKNFYYILFKSLPMKVKIHLLTMDV